MPLTKVRETETFIEYEDIRLRKGLERFTRLDGVGVEAGIIERESRNYPDGTDIVMVATVQHDGEEEKNIPSRPWIAIAFDRNLPYMTAQMEDAAENILLGRTSAGAQMALVGQQLKSFQRATLQQIRSLGGAPLQDSTILRKAANRASGRKPKPPGGYPVDQPLIETQHLLENHVFVVEGV